MGHVLVVGSINVDLVVSASHLPSPGETVGDGTFSRHFGGKGANQAVAAARAGALVEMRGAVGDDADGEASLAALEAEGINIGHIRRVRTATGVAIIAVAPNGENQIVVAPGANALVSAEDVAPDRGLAADVVLTCLEVPMPAVIAAVQAAVTLGATALVNPAPARVLPPELLDLAPILTPNAEELLVMTGSTDLEAGIDQLLGAGAPAVIVTLGANGVLLAEGSRRRTIPALEVKAVDSTGAGDTFAGVLAAWLAAGSDLDGACEAANCAAGLSVTRHGARSGMPTRGMIARRVLA